MSGDRIPHRVVELTPGRRAWLNTLDLARSGQRMQALLEADVTVPRRVIAEHLARTGERLSLTGFLVFCLARALDENKQVHAYRKGRKQLAVFDDVDVNLMVEHAGGGERALMGHVIRGANRRTFREIHDEIRSVQSAPAPSGRGMPAWFRSAMLAPWPLSALAKSLARAAARRDPTFRVRSMGTVFVSSLGMFGKGHSGWGIATIPHSLGMVVGGIAWKPAVVEGRVEPREMVNLTMLLDHNVVDGAPATRFLLRLVELVESGDGMEGAEPTADS